MLCANLALAQVDTIIPNIISAGGKYQVNHFTSENGLKGVVTEHIFQDSKGYVWICTRSGLNKLNGINIESFTELDGLTNNYTKWVEEDKKGLIWVATNKGVSCYNGKGFTNYTSEEGLSFNQTWCLLEYEDGGMLVGTSDGIDLIKDGVIEHFMDFDTTNIRNNMVRSMNYDSQGNFWVGASNYYYKILEDGSKEKIHKTGPPIAFEETSDGAIWMCGWDGNLCSYKDGKKTIYPMGTPIQEIEEDKDGNLWLASWEEGLLKFDGDQTVFQFSTKEGLSNNILWHLMIDAEGCIWSATYGGGANQLVTERFSVVSRTEGLPNNTVNDVALDSFGNIWAATDGGIAKILPNGDVEYFDEDDGLVNGLVQSIIVDRNNHVWAVLYAGGKSLIEITPEGKPILHTGGGFDIIEDSRSNKWMCADGGGTSKITPDLKRQRYGKSNQSQTRSFNAYEDSDTNIWIGIDNNGYHIYDYKTDTYIEDVIPDYLRFEEGGQMAQDNDGYYWLAMGRRGIYYSTYGNGKVTFLDSLSIDNGLLDNAVAGILIEGDVMWINTLGGLSKLDLAEYYESGKFSIKSYDYRKGFVGEGFSPLVRKNEDELVMGSSKGVLTFRESKDKEITSPPFTNIVDVKLNKKVVDWHDKGAKLKPNSKVPNEIYLDHTENHLTFQFIGISFSAPKEVRYSYILEGFDEDWSPLTDQREIVYSNIAPGAYTFKVKSVNVDGFWDESPDTIKITITPPFWQTWWFRTIMVFVGLILIISIFRWRLRKLQKDKQRLESQVVKRTEQLQVAYNQIEEKNHEITDSISYAKGIQEAILPPSSQFTELMGDSFVFYRPKDIVAGDFYWLNTWNNKVLFAAADCTGHGVPGAMVSVVCHGALNRSVREFDLHEPAKILDKTREIVIETFSESERDVKDGMDVSLCCLDRKHGTLEFAGANNSLYIVKNRELEEVKADKQPVGNYEFAEAFTNHSIKVEEGMCIYLFSDGYADQFGGPKGKKLKYKPFKEILLKIHQLPMDEQKEILNREFEKWKGDFEQVDDVCIIGVRL